MLDELIEMVQYSTGVQTRDGGTDLDLLRSLKPAYNSDSSKMNNFNIYSRFYNGYILICYWEGHSCTAIG